MKQNEILILAGAAVALFLLTRKKTAATSSPAATNAKFYQSPAVAAQIQTDQNQTAQIAGGIFSQLIGKVFGGTGNAVTLDVNKGEAQAAAVYAANPGSFTSPDPFAAYSQDAIAANVSPSQMIPNTGYVDNTEY